MKTKPALWAVAGLPVLFLLLLAGSVRGLSYLRDPSGVRDALPSALQEPQEGLPPAQPMKPADAKTAMEIKKAAGGQIAALQKRNYKAALRFALPDFQKHFLPEAFGQMIETDYNELTTAKSVVLAAPKISTDGVSATVPVLVRDAQKRETRFIYLLNRAAPPAKSGSKAFGAWHVSSCIRATPPPLPPTRSLHEA